MRNVLALGYSSGYLVGWQLLSVSHNRSFHSPAIDFCSNLADRSPFLRAQGSLSFSTWSSAGSNRKAEPVGSAFLL
jgi:hypothetical protein